MRSVLGAKNKGFTIVELMMVIGIIGVLVGIAVPVYIANTKDTADATRLSYAKAIPEALERYKDAKGNYPANTDNDWGGWDGDADGIFIKPLKDEGFISKMFKDPTGRLYHASGNMHYYRYGAGSYGADSSRGCFYVFGIRDMEKSGNPHPDSPGFSTPGRNWQNDFDWVTGKYQR
ncbi:MAG: type II secretion system protein [Actinomycetota bacterium]|nr:type II secretion system protein [Actinomycetota bacterium]